MQVWDVFSNKEAVDIVASAPSRSTAAKALVDRAVQAWKLKFPTSKSDDCAVVCLFLKSSSSIEIQESASVKNPKKSMVSASITGETTDGKSQGKSQGMNSDASWVQDSAHMDGTTTATTLKDEKLPDRCQSTRSIADCISKTEDEEWCALEGVTRVNSLLNIPRLRSGDRNSASWRKWLL